MQENVPVAGKQFGVTWVVFSGGENGENFLAFFGGFCFIYCQSSLFLRIFLLVFSDLPLILLFLFLNPV